MRLFVQIVLLLTVMASAKSNNSESTLVTRDLIDLFLETSSQITELTQKHLSLNEYSGKQDLSNSSALVEYLENSSIYPQLEAILKQSKFTNLSELTSFSERLMGMRLHLQMKSSKEASVFQTVAILTANLNTMRANSASETIIKQTEVLLAQQTDKAATFQKLLDKISELDKQFVEKNAHWFDSRFSR